MATATVGLVGWGRMGGAVGRRIVGAGLDLVVFDVAEAACRDAAEVGARVVSCPREAADGRDVVITMLPDDRLVREASSGAKGVLAGLGAGCLWVEMTSSHPDTTIDVANQAAARGALFLDAPVTGGVSRALRGELTVITAGDPAALAAAEPILQHLASSSFHVGSQPGMADVVKTVNNFLSAANLVTAAEGLAITNAAGIDPAVVLKVINAGTGQSNATTWKIPQYVLTGAFDSKFTVGQYLKDLRIAMRMVQELGLRLQVAPLTCDIWQSLEEGGFADHDHTETVRIILDEAAEASSG